ncbi:putative Transcription initiation factor IIF subunit beta [Quillaja saponaria]|uniref:Transcription initiation factor IIF subunit beta n=1 Tax=Quillaja saponaria TaxID=32244 RepID=A0AAD7Q5D2_QUISA|nr:putative Transcription initiation factor IIF subunit beta [Quillaja saponaria]
MDSEYVETSKADRPLWLMKCPPVVSSCLQQVDGSEPSPPVAKVVLSIDPLHADDDDSHTQFTLELAATESGDTPKCYTMDMSKEFVPMSVFSESSQGD